MEEVIQMFQKRLMRAVGAVLSVRSSFQFAVRGICLCSCLLGLLLTGEAQAAQRTGNEPGWIPVVFARGALQAQIDATPIENRPYRPFHFYGNTVRRMHYRGTPLPRFREVIATPVLALSRASRTDRLEEHQEARVMVRRERPSGIRVASR